MALVKWEKCGIWIMVLKKLQLYCPLYFLNGFLFVMKCPEESRVLHAWAISIFEGFLFLILHMHIDMHIQTHTGTIRTHTQRNANKCCKMAH